jgi:C1A family cysteine protease
MSKMNRKYNVKPDPIDLRDQIYHSQVYRHPDHLPMEIDLRPTCSPVVDQGELGSCTANAIASGLREYLELKAGKSPIRLSRLYLYWHERALEGTIDQDSGAAIRDGMRVLQKLGCPPEMDFPYMISQFTVKPSPQAELDASKFRVKSYHRVPNLISLKTSLAEGWPVVVGFMVYESFESEKTAQTGLVSIPKEGESLLGGHAVLAVGYKEIENKKYIIIRNSWGSGWGDQGYCYFPEAMFTNGIVTDMWTAY